jgi:hypothetical protein
MRGGMQGGEMSAPLDLYHLNFNRPATRQESTEMLERAGVDREVIDWFWEQLERFYGEYEDKIGCLEYQISCLEDDLKDALKIIEEKKEATAEVEK